MNNVIRIISDAGGRLDITRYNTRVHPSWVNKRERDPAADIGHFLARLDSRQMMTSFFFSRVTLVLLLLQTKRFLTSATFAILK